MELAGYQLNMLPRAEQEALVGQEHFSRGQWENAMTLLEAIRLEPDCARLFTSPLRCANGRPDRLEVAGILLQAAVRLEPKTRDGA